MKLADIKAPIDGDPITTVPIKLANHEQTLQVGVRLLSIAERAEALVQAVAFAKERGVNEWKNDDPICTLGLWTHTVAKGTFDVELGKNAPFATVEELLKSPFIGQENIAYLYEQVQNFEDSQHLRVRSMGLREVFDACVRIAQGEKDFLDSLRPVILRELLRITVGPYLSYQISSLPPTSEDTQSPETQQSSTTT